VSQPEATDEALMRRYVVDGDRAAFQELFRRYADRLIGMFRRSGCSEAVAQDMLQQTFLHVHRARNDFHLDSKLRPWLFTIATNVKREHYRRLQRKPESSFDPERHPEPATAPAASSASDRLVRRALSDLPDAQREVILLHWYEELGFNEIAQIVGASVSAVKVRAHRGYERLREALREDK
jgi:RNA polymerase sigma factor (sigma-70 family)